MTDKEKIQKIAEIVNGGNTMKVLQNAEKSVKEKLGFTVEFNIDGTIRKAWWGEKPTRAKKEKKEATTTEAKTETKPEEKKK